MGQHDIAFTMSGRRSNLVTGLYGSTRVLTVLGWQEVAALRAGDLILTRELGLMPVVDALIEPRQALWSVCFPAGSIGNEKTERLPPGQPVLIQTAVATPFSGDDMALVPATSLEGWRGIAPQVPALTEIIVQLRLEREAIIFAGPGLMVGCRGTDRGAFDLKRLFEWPSRPTIPLSAARHLAAHLVAAEAGAQLGNLQAADLRPPPNLS